MKSRHPSTQFYDIFVAVVKQKLRSLSKSIFGWKMAEKAGNWQKKNPINPGHMTAELYNCLKNEQDAKHPKYGHEMVLSSELWQ